MYLHEQLSIYIFTLRDRFYRKPSYDTNMTKRTQIFFLQPIHVQLHDIFRA